MLVATNDAFVLYDKSGRVLDQVDSLDMFSSVASSSGYGWGDPRTFFDPRDARYFLAFVHARPQPGCRVGECTLHWLLAVSRSSDPRSMRQNDWHLYAFDGTLERARPSATSDGDFLVMGADARKLVLHGSVTSSSGDTYIKLWVFDKAPLLEGRPVVAPQAEFLDVRDPESGERLAHFLPAGTSDDPGKVLLVGRSPTGCSVIVGGIAGSAPDAVLTTRKVRIAGACRAAPHSPQLGGGTPIVNFGEVMSPPVYENGRLWLTHAVPVNADPSQLAGIRVVELDVSGWPAVPSVVSDVTIQDAGAWYSYPALTANGRGDVALVAARSNFAEYASIWYTGRLGTDPAGIFRPRALLTAGQANLNQLFSETFSGGSTFNKFADFNGAATDPTDGSAWIIGTYASDVCEWGTWVVRLDWSVATSPIGSSPVASTPRSGPPCSPLPRAFAIRFVSSATVAPNAMYVFEYGGADLTDPGALQVVYPDPSLRWTVPSPGTFVLSMPAGYCPPGFCKLVVRLASGREAGAFFTVPP